MIVEPIPFVKRCRNYLKQIENVYFLHMKIHIPFLVVCVGQACTLKCKNCSNLTPYAPANCKSYDYLKICQDISRLLDVAEIDLIQIQGGEPFVYSPESVKFNLVQLPLTHIL